MWRYFIITCLLACGLDIFAVTPFPPFAPTVYVYDLQLIAPLQPIAKLIGASLQENLRNGEITFAYRGKTFRFQPGNVTAKLDTRNITLPIPPHRRAGVLYLPLVALAEAFGGTVQDEAVSQQVVLMLPGAFPLFMPRKANYFAPWDPRITSSTLFVVNIAGDGFYRLTYDDKSAYFPSISHDGTKLLWVNRDDGEISLSALNSTRVQQLKIIPAEHNARDDNPFFASDDKHIIYQYSEYLPNGKILQQVRSMAVDGTERRIICKGDNLSVSPDGRWMTYQQQQPTGTNEELFIDTLAGKSPRSLGVNKPSPIFSSDSRHLIWKVVSQTQGHYMCAIMLGTITPHGIEKKELLQEADVDCEIHAGCFSPDSRRVVCGDHGLAIYDLASGKRTTVLDNVYVNQPSFTPDGKHLVFVCQDQLCACRPDGSNLRRLTSIMLANIDEISADYCYADNERIIFTASQE